MAIGQFRTFKDISVYLEQVAEVISRVKGDPVHPRLRVENNSRSNEHVGEGVWVDPFQLVPLKVYAAVAQERDRVFCVHVNLKISLLSIKKLHCSLFEQNFRNLGPD